MAEKSLVTRHGEPQSLGDPYASTIDSGSKSYTQSVDLNNAPPAIRRGMKRRAASAVTTDAVAQTFFSPFRTRPSLEAPTKRVDLNEWYRYYAKHDPVVGTAVELHAYFPLSKFDLEHEDARLMDLFKDEADALELDALLPRIGLEHWLVGEAFPFGFLDDPKDPARFERFILLDPDKIKINRHPFAQGRHNRDYVIRLQPDGDLKKIVQNGPNNPHTGELYRNIPQDIIDYVRANKTIPLHPLQVSHFKREGNPFNVRGESIISRVLQDLMYLDKLRDAQYHIADRHVVPTELYLVGESGNEADEAELQDFQNVLAQTWTSFNRAIVWHHALKAEWLGASGKILPLSQEYEYIEKRILSGLMMNRAFLEGSGPTFANASIALDILIARYMEYRDKIERWLVKAIFEPICKMNSIYKPKESELAHRIRVRDPYKKPWTPDISWSRPTLRDDAFKIALYERLVHSLMLPRDELYKLLNKNPKQMREQLMSQRRQDEIDRQQGLAAPTMPGMGGGMGMGMGLPTAMPGMMPGMGGGMGMGGLPGGLPMGGMGGAPGLPTPGMAGGAGGAGMRPPVSSAPAPTMPR